MTMRRPKFLRSYTPPAFADMAAALPGFEPAKLARYYDLMCQAMRHKVYDRSEALDRLRSIAEHQQTMDATMARLRVWAEAEQCYVRYDRGYIEYQAGVKRTWDGRYVDDERAEPIG